MATLRLAAALVLSCGSSACAISVPSIDQQSVLRRHYIVAHEDGWPITDDPRLPRRDLSAQDYDAQLAGILAGIDRHAQRLWARPNHQGDPLRLLLFVHGGLNGYGAGFARMTEMLPGRGARREGEEAEVCPDMLAADPTYPLFSSAWCGRAQTTYYPVFINWNSGLVDSIGDDLIFIRFGRRLQGPWKAGGLASMPFVLGARVAEAVFSLPNSVGSNVMRFWAGRPEAADLVEGAVMSPIRLLTTPALKAFGTAAWEIMKRRAELVTAEHLPDNGTGIREGAARGLVRKIAERIGPRGDGFGWQLDGESTPRGPVEVTLVGHSMGAIVINRLLATEPTFPVTRIVYLAPAASNYEIELLVEPHLRRGSAAATSGTTPGGAGGGSGPSRFHTYALHSHDENLETQPKSFILPRGTLLVWIDNYFEPVVAAGHQRFGRYQGYRSYYAPDGRARRARIAGHEPCQWSRLDVQRPVRHGDLDAPAIVARVLAQVDPAAFAEWKPTVSPPVEMAPVPCEAEAPRAR